LTGVHGLQQLERTQEHTSELELGEVTASGEYGYERWEIERRNDVPHGCRASDHTSHPSRDCWRTGSLR
jgi:hypothetical protein